MRLVRTALGREGEMQHNSSLRSLTPMNMATASCCRVLCMEPEALLRRGFRLYTLNTADAYGTHKVFVATYGHVRRG